MDIREIARRAKVSTATVSRAINRIPTVDPQLAKRVWKVVDELGYYPNTQARALVSGRSRIFGLIVSEITNPFFPEIVQTFENLAVENNYEILITSTVHDPKRMESSVRRMIERRVDGVAILTFGMEDTLLDASSFSQGAAGVRGCGAECPWNRKHPHQLFEWYTAGGAAPRRIAAYAYRIYRRPVAFEIGGSEEGGIQDLDGGDWATLALDRGRKSSHGWRNAGAGRIQRSKRAAFRRSVLQRYDSHRIHAGSL